MDEVLGVDMLRNITIVGAISRLERYLYFLRDIVATSLSWLPNNCRNHPEYYAHLTFSPSI
jgi:hypothetical protein